jgi:quinol monooxygenase YgiN/mannose-6-phosphate isomerase-like protein (cupin superfamily)
MAAVGRYAKLIAREGQGEALAEAMLRVAEGLAETAGCELYIVNRSRSEADTIWVTELWLSQEALDSALESARSQDGGRTRMQDVQELLAGSEQIDLEPLGGIGHLAGEGGFTIQSLEAVEDQAPKFGLGDFGEARFARRDLNARATGISLQRLRPGRRQAFGHRHRHAEEVYIVLGGSGRVRVDDEIRDVRERDAIRVAPDSFRAFEAGPEGLELLAVGAHHSGETEMAADFWPTDG